MLRWLTHLVCQNASDLSGEVDVHPVGSFNLVVSQFSVSCEGRTGLGFSERLDLRATVMLTQVAAGSDLLVGRKFQRLQESIDHLLWNHLTHEVVVLPRDKLVGQIAPSADAQAHRWLVRTLHRNAIWKPSCLAH
jgi:hypothetical protein